MANIKFEIDGKIYDFAPESFVIDNEGNIILKSKSSAEKMNPFEKVKEGEWFHVLDEYGDVRKAKEGFMCSGPALYEVANYCTDAELLRRRALYEKLERCLWRFSMENGGSGDYYPTLDKASRGWFVSYTASQRFGPSFKTIKTCGRAIEEVIKPMLDGIAEEEIFVWGGV
jgi:hypothetical protein|nr:MAG TPA: hypothetical protein [Herelleviridae sp.]